MAFPSISSLFGGSGNQQQQPNPQQQQQQLSPGQASPGNISNPASGTGNTPTGGVVPTDQNTNTGIEATKNPLDEFSKLWETPKTDPNAPPAENMFNVDPAKLREAAGKVDFSQTITPEIRAAIAKGGEEGVNASLAAMNTVTQAVYAQSALATTKIVERAISQASEKWNSELPAHIKKHQVGNSLREENPALNHEAVKPLTSALEAQFVQKFPNATAKELNDMSKEYLKSVFTQVFPDYAKVPEVKGKPGAKEENWDEFLSM